MAKRFTATEKWQDPWFCGLSMRDRSFWQYILDTCDHAGIWQVNWPLVKFYHGPEFEFNETAFSGRLVKLSEEKWFIPKFIAFQYGDLDERNRAHASVIRILQKEGAWMALISSIEGRKDMDTDKDQDKEKKKVKELSPAFLAFWDAYPRKVDKQDAIRSWDKIEHEPEVDAHIMSGLAAHKASDQWTKDGGAFIPHPATWLNKRRWESQPPPRGTNGASQRTGVPGRIVGAAAPVPGKYDDIERRSRERFGVGGEQAKDRGLQGAGPRGAPSAPDVHGGPVQGH